MSEPWGLSASLRGYKTISFAALSASLTLEA